MQCINADVVDVTLAEVVVKFAEQLVSDRFREADYCLERRAKFVAHICKKSDFARLAIPARSIAFCSLSSVRFFSVILSLMTANCVVVSDSSQIRKFETLSQYRSPDFRVFVTLLSHYPVRLDSSWICR